MKLSIFITVAVSMLVSFSSSANAEMVVVAGGKSPTTAMTVDQVAQVFLGKSTSHVPVDQNDSNPIRGEFYKKVTDKDSAQVKSIWSKLVFTGKATLPKEGASSADVKRLVNADPNAIGYVEKSSLDGTVKSVLVVQ